VTVTAELGGDLEVGRMVVLGGPEDHPASKDKGLGRGTGPDQGFQSGTLRAAQWDALRER
jgi:hypothetical protein